MTYTARTLRNLVLGAAAASLIALTACGSAAPEDTPSPTDSVSATPSASASPSASPSPTVSVSPSPDLSGITVTGDDRPKIEVKAPWNIASTQVKVLKEGGKQIVGENATVSYYGVGLEGLIPAEKVAAAPCLLHIAEKDGFVPAEARAVILKNAAVQAEMPAHVYPGCDHAFARPNGEHYDAAAADLARERTLAFLQR